MYLSDLMVAAYDEGKIEGVKFIINALNRLPDEWWDVRGCRNWLKTAELAIAENEEAFIKKLDTYKNSDAYKQGKKELDEV